MSDTSKCDQHSVASMKMSSKWCRIHGSSRPRKPPVAIIHIFARIFEVQLGGHGRDKRGKERTTERWGWKSSPTWARFGWFRGAKSEIFIKNPLGLSLKLWFLCGRGAHSYKKGGKRRPENENWVRKAFDGEFDAYMRRLGGAKKRKCWKGIGF